MSYDRRSVLRPSVAGLAARCSLGALPARDGGRLGAAAVAGGRRRGGACSAAEVGTQAGRGELRLAPVVTVVRHPLHHALLFLMIRQSIGGHF